MSIAGIAQRFAGVSKILTAFVVLVLLRSGRSILNNGDGKHTSRSTSSRPTRSTRALTSRSSAFPFGRVEKLTPRGDVVRAKISYDGDIKLPADVKAVVVSPSIVGDRFIQLAPAYNGGAALKDDAFLSVDRTAVPIELDAIYQSLDDLAVALGPKACQTEDGALSRFIGDSPSSLTARAPSST